MAEANISYLFVNVNLKFLYHNKKCYFEIIFGFILVKSDEKMSRECVALMATADIVVKFRRMFLIFVLKTVKYIGK